MMTKEKSTLLQCIGMFLIASAIGLSGCSAGRPPVKGLSQAELAVHEAERSKAGERVSPELDTARQQLESAKQAMNAKEYERARRLAENALVNAQLAEAKADAESTQQVADELRKSIEALRAEIQRTPPTIPSQRLER
jgi:predicted S18 family serine protease